MAPSRKIEVILAPPLNGEFYSGDDQINGQVKLTLTKSLPIKTITVNLKGFMEATTSMDSEFVMIQNGMLVPHQDNKSYHNLINLETRVFPPDNVWNAIEGSSKPFKLQPGEYEYSFQFEKLKGKAPSCVKGHGKSEITFTKPAYTKLPPSFNNQWKNLNKVDSLDLFFYSFGKVIYMVQVNIELGKARSWYKPFDKFIRENEVIEYIPNIRDITYERGEDNPKTSEILYQSSTLTTLNTNAIPGTVAASEDAVALRIRHPNDTATTTTAVQIDPESASKSHLFLMENDQQQPQQQVPSNIPNGTNFIQIHKSSGVVRLPDNESTMSIQVRTKNNGFRRLFRYDPLFQRRCNKFDNIYVVFQTPKQSVSMIRNLQVALKSMQLNLYETVTFLSHGIGNENLSSLRLAEVDFTNCTDPIFNMNELEVVFEDPKSNEVLIQCQLRLKDHSKLKQMLFNVEDYKHRGNRLFSFKSCSIKREFDLQLVLNWEINGTAVSPVEVAIEKVQIYCQKRPRRLLQRDADEFLPRYEEPPTYEAVGEEERTEESNGRDSNKKDSTVVT